MSENITFDVTSHHVRNCPIWLGFSIRQTREIQSYSEFLVRYRYEKILRNILLNLEMKDILEKQFTVNIYNFII